MSHIIQSRRVSNHTQNTTLHTITQITTVARRRWRRAFDRHSWRAAASSAAKLISHVIRVYCRYYCSMVLFYCLTSRPCLPMMVRQSWARVNILWRMAFSKRHKRYDRPTSARTFSLVFVPRYISRWYAVVVTGHWADSQTERCTSPVS